ncbi:MAG: hypothetical protein LW807_04745 [Proteobacteria bacterium]|jgi:hypothetical protein|nr:hypothetical protein [Pseudomonadota bacterium]
MQQIQDPRKYSKFYPESNIIISQALMVQNNKASVSMLVDTLRNLLRDQNDALINIALNLAPSVEVSQIIWTALSAAVNDASSINELDGACIFAIPIVLVAGNKNNNKQSAKLPKKLDTEVLNQFFSKNNLINACHDSFISGKLVSPQNLAKIKPSQIYYWVRNLKNAKLWIPLDIDGSEVEVLDEGVFLRFLIGVAVKGGATSLNGAVSFANYRQMAMPFMQLIVDELKTDNITMFPIPFAPVNLLSGFSCGDSYRKEIAIQVALSNVVRKIREQALVPVVQIIGVENAIELKTSYQEVTTREIPSEIINTLKETSLWHLTAYDDFAAILNKITDLLQEMNVEYTYHRSN